RGILRETRRAPCVTYLGIGARPARDGERMTDPASQSALLRREIMERVRELYALDHAAKPFVPGETFIPYSGRVFDGSEIEGLVHSALDAWIAVGPRAAGAGRGAHGGPVRGGVQARAGRLHRVGWRRLRQFRFVGQPAGSRGVHVPEG